MCCVNYLSLSQLLHLLLACVILSHSHNALCSVLMFAHDNADCVSLCMEDNHKKPCWERTDAMHSLQVAAMWSSHKYCILQAQSMLSFETLLKTRCSLRANKMAVLLSNDKHDDDTPIIEAVASDFMLSLSGQAARQQLSSQCGAKLGLDVYNNGLMGWEPLLEPWTSSLAFSMPLTR